MELERWKRLPAVQETCAQSLGGEDPLEKEMATHSSILAWRIPWMEEPGGLQSTGSQRVGHDWATSLAVTRVSWGEDSVSDECAAQGTWVCDTPLCWREGRGADLEESYGKHLHLA